MQPIRRWTRPTTRRLLFRHGGAGGAGMETKRTKDDARRTIAERRAEADERARATIDVLQRATARQHAEALLIALDRIMVRGRSFVLDTFADLLRLHVWACDADGDIIGHVLTVDAEALDIAAGMDRLAVWTLPEALNHAWQNDDERHAWRAEYVQALRRIADEQESIEQALTDRAELLRVVERDDGRA